MQIKKGSTYHIEELRTFGKDTGMRYDMEIKKGDNAMFYYSRGKKGANEERYCAHTFYVPTEHAYNVEDISNLNTMRSMDVLNAEETTGLVGLIEGLAKL